MNPRLTLQSKGELPKHVREAITEMQSRVWRLCNLIQCVRETNTDLIEDYEAAMSGLVEYADDIYHEMDADIVAARAMEIKVKLETGP